MTKILLNPGPVTLSKGVRSAAADTDFCHREQAFLDIQKEVIDGLLAVYDCDPETWACIALGGSGTTAMEAMVTSIVPYGQRLLVIENGVYGERLSRIARIHDIDHDALSLDWGQAIDLEELGSRLRSGAYGYLAAVHHETTTGRLNPLAEIADVCARHGVSLLADTVSSFGVEDIPFGHPALAACAGTANKALHGIPGLAFVMSRRYLLGSDAPERTLYLHLPRWAEAQQKGSTPFTPPVNAYLALKQALQELRQQGGWHRRHARYSALAESVRRALSGCGVSPWLAPEDSSCALRSYRLPDRLTYNELYDAFEDRGFVIYAGQGGLSGEMFRISTMGEINDSDLARLINTINDIFSDD